MSKLVILDGLDNTGKSTTINRILKVLLLMLYKVNVIHLNKPPKDIPAEKTSEYQHNYYMKLMDDLKSCRDSYDYVILDRGWISEYVYGVMYRNRNKMDVVDDNVYLDLQSSKIFDKVYLFILMADADFLCKHDDGLSLSKNNLRNITSEYYKFLDGFNLSTIKYKEKLCVESHGNYAELLPHICQIITQP